MRRVVPSDRRVGGERRMKGGWEERKNTQNKISIYQFGALLCGCHPCGAKRRRKKKKKKADCYQGTFDRSSIFTKKGDGKKKKKKEEVEKITADNSDSNTRSQPCSSSPYLLLLVSPLRFPARLLGSPVGGCCLRRKGGEGRR